MRHLHVFKGKTRCKLCGAMYILQCDMAMASLYRMPFLGVSSLNFGPLATAAFFFGCNRSDMANSPTQE
jgi:hypothetical protein